MPNWCFNNLDISHSNPAVVDEVRLRVESLEQDSWGGPIGFLKGLDPSWEYREACDIWWEPTDDGITVSFSSAWEPPVELYEALTEKGWDVTGSYYEEGLDFAGIYEAGENKRLNDLSEYDDDYFVEDDLAKRLEDEWGILESREEIEYVTIE